MKNLKLIFWLAIFATIVFNGSVNANKWRVNRISNYLTNGTHYGENLGGNSVFPVFDTPDNAQNSNLVSDYDTLYLEGTGNSLSYPGFTLTRPLVLIGTGYFLDLNAASNVSNDQVETRMDNIVFAPGSEGSQIIGVHVVSAYGIDVSTSNIMVKRCLIEADITLGYTATMADITIIQNFINNSNSSNGSGVVASGYGIPQNLIISHNIFMKILSLYNNTGTYNIAECNNNVFDCPVISGTASIRLNTPSFQNNIIKTANAIVDLNSGIASSNVIYNVCATASQLNTTDPQWHNLLVSNMQTIFVPVSTSTDGNYQLDPTWAALNQGSAGGDRGAYGGPSITSRYTLSGLPPVPVIYDITTTGVASPVTGLPVTIKARTIK
ncbi:MAG: hypothetical protein IPJ66_00910 [Bacteroidetes bacterium]|nr:hypothetical protein [Bacteroidota bacterium]MBL0064670.1 hypothetical protein [Bacteroidota bacterium]